MSHISTHSNQSGTVLQIFTDRFQPIGLPISAGLFFDSLQVVSACFSKHAYSSDTVCTITSNSARISG